MKKYLYHADGAKPKNEGVVFVFGSNLAGIHGAGAAKEALISYGAKWAVGVGHQGTSYAIPSKDRDIESMPLSEIKKYVELFKEYAAKNPKIGFFVTRVGCGLAGYRDSDIAPMFVGSPTNCSFAEEWEQYLETGL
jgi:hypothetical protein